MLGTHGVVRLAQRRALHVLLAFVLGAGLGALLLATPAAAATIIVDSTDDGLATDGHVTLREAITAINGGGDIEDVVATGAAYGTDDTIKFSIASGLQVITLPAPLPSLNNPMLVDGWSQGGVSYTGPPLIALDGIAAGFGTNALQLNAAGVTVRGLIIQRFHGNGIVINAANDTVLGSYIGTNPSGTAAMSNFGDGIFVAGSGATIGGTGTGERNVISGNIGPTGSEGNGITVCSCASATILGNHIGTDITGTSGIPNAEFGVLVLDATGVTIGGATASARNVISSNGAGGIGAFSSSEANLNLTIAGNYIGTDATGTATLPNSQGITVNDAGGVTISGNLISGNTSVGIAMGVTTPPGPTAVSRITGNLIGLRADGTAALPNGGGIQLIDAANVTVGGTSASDRNVISGNTTGIGVFVGGANTTGAVVAGNYIGTNPAGTGALANVQGVEVQDAPGVMIGGTATGAGNLISGNSFEGVAISGLVTGTTLAGNLIGTDKNGTAALGNVSAGVHIHDAVSGTAGVPSVIVGGSSAAARNVISGNGGANGVIVSGTSSGAVIAGNYIGITPSGAAALANDIGIMVAAGSGTTIGGTATGAGNVISGNTHDGVQINSASSTTVVGNVIGLTADGTTALGNGGVGNPGVGVNVVSGTGAVVGGSTAGARNVISGNMDAGILLTAPATVRGNYIGSGKNGTAPVPNQGPGVNVDNVAGVTIGGTNAADANLIIANVGAGVRVSGSSAQAAILGNSITDNALLPIDLVDGGPAVTLNDPGDGDTGPNGLQNFPDLTSAASTVSAAHISGTLTSIASQTYSVELYTSTHCGGVGPYGEGQTFLGRVNVMTDGTGVGSFNASVPPIPLTNTVSATATDASGNTSEFAHCIGVVTPDVQVTPSGGSIATVEGGATASFDVVLTSQPTAPVTFAMAPSVNGLASFAPSSTLTFTAANWNVPQTVTVSSVDDQIYNLPSYTIGFTVSSSDPFYNNFPVAALPATHTDNDPRSSLTAANASASELASGTSTLSFTVSANPPSGSPITVQYATSNGTATGGTGCTSGVDYLADSGTLTIPPFQTSKTVSVTICSDAISENPETLALTLSNPTVATIGQATATGTILDGTVLALAIADATVVEGNSGTTAMTFPVTLGMASPGTVTVQYTTNDGTAQGNVDYQSTSGTLTFNPGETSKSITVNVIGDGLFEPNETFKVTLSNPTGGATVARVEAIGTIQNDDQPQPCQPRPPVQVRPTAGGGQLQVTVASSPLNTGPANPITTIRFGTFQNAAVTLNGQAITSGQTVNIPANTSSVTFTVARVTPNQATTVPFTVVDTCGEWPTLVGGGTNAF
jgi:hypothetical protein